MVSLLPGGDQQGRCEDVGTTGNRNTGRRVFLVSGSGVPGSEGSGKSCLRICRGMAARIIIGPKVVKFRKEFHEMLKEGE